MRAYSAFNPVRLARAEGSSPLRLLALRVLQSHKEKKNLVFHNQLGLNF